MTRGWFTACRLVKPIKVPCPQSLTSFRFIHQKLIRVGNKFLTTIFRTKIVSFRVKSKRWHRAVFGNFHLTYRIDKLIFVIVGRHITPLSFEVAYAV